MEKIRGAGISMVFQEPMTSLNPVFTIGEQIMETVRAHEGCPLAPSAIALSKCSIASASRRPPSG
jgi:ABC-type microcin C transport system duplicated ATPase subunit YejF